MFAKPFAEIFVLEKRCPAVFVRRNVARHFGAFRRTKTPPTRRRQRPRSGAFLARFWTPRQVVVTVTLFLCLLPKAGRCRSCGWVGMKISQKLEGKQNKA
ncbi:Hypothetical protein, putative [Bodo saltans]|uniref:Uncharacterized protein n=1 Tax=Bodo saltans TaxID=75058 RepID=A0A0S4J106_BODSA|nr:Hypothetical protein, putative [Bodo saltans]|eukprot:CUG51195.1 Hypothetical protein, putative [Bodo saltans]